MALRHVAQRHGMIPTHTLQLLQPPLYRCSAAAAALQPADGRAFESRLTSPQHGSLLCSALVMAYTTWLCYAT